MAVSAAIKDLRRAEFPSGRTIYAQGDPGDDLYIIVEGRVKIGRRTVDGVVITDSENLAGRAQT